MTDNTKPVPSTEFALEGTWVKSSYSDQGGGNCVEVAFREAWVGIRDSKKKDGPTLSLPQSTYATFINTVKSGAVDFGVVD